MKSKNFVTFASAIFLISASGKFLSVLFNHALAAPAHQVFPFFSQRDFMVISGLCELGLLMLLWSDRVTSWVKTWIVYCVSVCFILYHILLVFFYHAPRCGCFGIFRNHTFNQILDWGTYAAIAFLFLGGILTLTRESRSVEAPAHAA